MVDNGQRLAEKSQETRRCTAPSPLRVGAVGLVVIAALAAMAFYVLG